MVDEIFSEWLKASYVCYFSFENREETLNLMLFAEKQDVIDPIVCNFDHKLVISVFFWFYF